MRLVTRPARLALILALGASIAAAGVATAQVKKGKSRVMKTSQLMKAVIKPTCGNLKKGLETAPANDEAWDDLAAAAAVLNETSYVLMEDGRCPDTVWADAASKTLREGSEALVKALEAKDHAAAKVAFGSLMGSCKGCHEKHKEKK